MTAYSDSLGFQKGTAALPVNSGLHRISLVQVELDFADIVAARAAANATALVATDTLQIIPLPAKSIVLSAGVEVVSVESTNTTATFDFGFTGGTPAAANVYANDLASNAVSFTAAALANPTVVGAADTIDLLLNTAAPTDAVLRCWAVVVDCS